MFLTVQIFLFDTTITKRGLSRPQSVNIFVRISNGYRCSCTTNFPRKCPQKPCRSRMPSRHSRMIPGVIRDALRALRDSSTAGMLGGSMEENSRRHTGVRWLSRDNGSPNFLSPKSWT
ncbi:hypothetical protein T09_12425 [Trichinella sp. T9]|nr:hypothetical protein T09_12425 [Trichinella sp. T9]